VVNYNAQDLADLNPGDGVCDAGFTACSLRAAIQEANAHSGADSIVFAIGSGNPTINVNDAGLGALPSLTEAVTINGNTGGATRVQINGNYVGANAVLWVLGGNSTIRGLVIN